MSWAYKTKWSMIFHRTRRFHVQMLKSSRYEWMELLFLVQVNDWNYKYGEPKHIFHRGDREAFSMSPGLWLHPEQNTLMVRVDTRGEDDPRLKKSMESSSKQ